LHLLNYKCYAHIKVIIFLYTCECVCNIFNVFNDVIIRLKMYFI